MPISVFLLLTLLAPSPAATETDLMPGVIEASAQVGCEVRATRSDSGTRLDAIITATGPVAGRYSFRVEPASGGEPAMAEESEFAIEEAGPFEVKKAGVDLPAGAGYRASLSIEWPNGASSCSAAAS